MLEECHQALLQIIPSVLALLNSNEPSKIVGGAKGVYFLADPRTLFHLIVFNYVVDSLLSQAPSCNSCGTPDGFPGSGPSRGIC